MCSAAEQRRRFRTLHYASAMPPIGTVLFLNGHWRVVDGYGRTWEATSRTARTFGLVGADGCDVAFAYSRPATTGEIEAAKCERQPDTIGVTPLTVVGSQERGSAERVLLRLERIGEDAVEAFRRLKGQHNWRARLRAGVMSDGGKTPRVWLLRSDGQIGRPLRYQMDYSLANGVGSRGVFAEYYLDVGRCYLIQEKVSWRRFRTYYGRAEQGGVVEISRNEAIQWASNP